MTRKDYVLLASVLRQEHDATVNKAFVRAIAIRLSDAIARENPRFDAQHFLAVITGERNLHSKPVSMRARTQVTT